MDAFSIEAGTLQIVAREVYLDTPELEVKEKVISASQALTLAKAVDSSLPHGALLIPDSVSAPSVQVTWNAHVKVRK